MKQALIDNYGYLFEDALIDEILKVGHVQSLEQGEVVIDYDQSVRYMPLLLEGAIKIMRQDSDGDELLLYFLESGDTCTMTMTCCMGNTKSEIRAVAEKDSTLIMIPVENMANWIQKYTGWMSFVFDSYSNRFTEMLEAIDSLAFSNMHDRIYRYLKDKVMVTKTTELDVTHQEIANDLHSSRVVISRLLKSLEKEGKIKISRNKLEVLEF
ncbi:MAG: Crp/Fnr family transcriptional regulator [Crocinitomicaceae bacterium]|nr:Crp/Fnr family transcriptional regulator [Crocinitomicaceae bacterium]